MNKYQVIVGNIGTVYDGNWAIMAKKVYKEYYEQSKDGYGRAAGESVTLWVYGEPIEDNEEVCRFFESLEKN